MITTGRSRRRRQNNTVRGERLVKWKKKDANFGGFFVVMLLALTTNASGQQIGNPTTQQDVTFPRSTYAIRNAHIITVGGADIDNGTVDTSETGELNPNAKAVIALNPHSAHIAISRVDGVTNAVSAPTGGLISGQAVWINLLGTTPSEMAIVPYAALVINYPRIAGRAGDFGGEQQPIGNLSETLATNERQVTQIRKMLRDAE